MQMGIASAVDCIVGIQPWAGLLLHGLSAESMKHYGAKKRRKKKKKEKPDP